MRLSDVSGYAVANLLRHKLRTVLTCTGVAVGVATLTVLVSLGAGLELMMSSQLDQAELITRVWVSQKGASRGNQMFGGMGPAQQEGPAGRAINDEAITRFAQVKGVDVAYPEILTILIAEHDARIAQAITDALPLRALGSAYKESLQAGGYWTSNAARNVCVLPSQMLRPLGYSDAESALGSKLAVTHYNNLFSYKQVVREREDPNNPGGPPLKELLWERPEGLTFRELEVIGVYDSSQFGFAGQFVHVPASVGASLGEDFGSLMGGLTKGEYKRAVVKVKNPHEDLESVVKEIEALGFETKTIFDILNKIKIVFVVFKVLLGLFGGIGLFVAFFGIANTMVMAVMERTREIGVLKALGGRNRDIRRIFVIEAASIGFLGGGAGVAFGWLVGVVLNAIANGVFKESNLGDLTMFHVEGGLIVIALLLSTLVAVVAGIYPAWRATRLDPVIALRRE